jgi:hypothetical protein
MFIGHYAAGFIAKKFAPRTSLGTYFFAAAFLDIVWPILVLTGWERVSIVPGATRFAPLVFESYPISHSLVMALMWATLFAVLYLDFTGYTRGSIFVWLCVASHWFLDALVHQPDLPLFPGSQHLIGLGLWNSVSGTLLVEGALFIAGVALYWRMTRSKGLPGHVSLWGFVFVVASLYIAGIFMQPPPSVNAVAVADLAGGFLFIGWGYWINQSRAPL